MTHAEHNFFFANLKEAADNVLKMVSQFIDVNTFCVASNDKSSSFIFSAFHRNEILFETPTTLSFYDAY
jgi:hypothetical protein